MKNKKILFIVQGEGRGHMTQAIALKELLETSSFKLSCVMVGKSPVRIIPEFFRKEIGVEIIEFDSPNFLQDKNAKRIKVGRSILYNLLRARIFFRSVRRISNVVKKYNPDLIINFYEPLAGLYNFLYRPEAKMICIAHQYIYLHPDFSFPKGVDFRNVLSVKWLTQITCLGAVKKFALSFYKLEREAYKSTKVIAPLLRKELRLQVSSEGNYILVYLLNSGLMQNIIEWHKRYPGTELHCFTDHKYDTEEWKYDNMLTFHRLNDKKFISFMAGAMGIVTTAGFETVCESMYLGKPVLMIPVQNHFEQFCNARDASGAGAGIFDNEFTIEKLLKYVFTYQKNRAFAEWVNENNRKVLSEISSVTLS